jgi:hypothetical protein
MNRTLIGPAFMFGLFLASCSGTEPEIGGLESSVGSHDFGRVLVGNQSPEFAITFTNTASDQSLSLAISVGGTHAEDFTITNSECGDQVLAPGASCELRVRFEPAVAGARQGLVRAVYNGDQAAGVTLTGTGDPTALVVPAAGLAFGDARIGSESAVRSLVVRNNSVLKTGPLTVTLGGTHAGDFEIVRDLCVGKELTAGAQCLIDIRFRPSVDGTHSASVQVSGTPGGTAIAPLSGVGGAPTVIAVAPASSTFEAVRVGSVGDPVPYTVSNTGASNSGELVLVITGPQRTEYELIGNQCISQRLAPGGSCSFAIRFRPAALGERGAVLEVRSGFSETVNAPLSAMGTAVVLNVNPTSLLFPETMVGLASTPSVLTIRNSGNVPSEPLQTSVAGLCGYYYYYPCGPTEFFEITADECESVALAPGASCTVSVRFVPQNAFYHQGTFLVSEDLEAGTNTQTTGLAGRGSGISPSSPNVDFGSIQANGTNSVLRTLTIVNNATATTGPIVVSQVSGAFATTSNGCGGVTLAPGASCTMQFRFLPPVPGFFNFEFTATANPGGSITIPFTGQGS